MRPRFPAARLRGLAPALALAALPAFLAGAAVDAQEAAGPVVARGRQLELTASELERTLVARYAHSDEGRDVLKLLLHSRVIERLAGEQGLSASAEDVDRLWRKLDLETKARGEAQGLAAELRRKGLAEGEFRDYLRLSILQERLARAALGAAEDAPVSGDQQEVWLQQAMEERGTSLPAPPWPDGIVARCGEVVVREAELGAALRRRLPAADVRETAWHLLLLRGIERRMPDLSAGARERAIDAEMARRRAEVEGQSAAQGVRFEQIVGARGTTVEALRADPSVRIAALSRLWVDRTRGADGLRAAYEAERSLFEGLHGRSVAARLHFLKAAKYANELNPRTFDEAEAELARLGRTLASDADLEAWARQYSEDPASRASGGDLGWVTRRDPRVPAAVPAALFRFLDTGGTLPAGGKAIGPVRLESGSALLWMRDVRESPPWEQMAEHVHEELRRRFLKDVLPPGEMELLAP